MYNEKQTCKLIYACVSICLDLLHRTVRYHTDLLHCAVRYHTDTARIKIINYEISFTSSGWVRWTVKSLLQYSTVQYSRVKYSTVQYSTARWTVIFLLTPQFPNNSHSPRRAAIISVSQPSISILEGNINISGQYQYLFMISILILVYLYM